MSTSISSFTENLVIGMPAIAPTYDAPWMPTLENITGMAIGTALVAIVAAVAIGGMLWLFGKLSSSGRAQEVGISIFLWGVIGGALIAGASALVRWGAGLPLFG